MNSSTLSPISNASLLSVIELLGYPNLRPLYERLSYRVLTEFSVRKATHLLRRERPAVIVADFYFQPDFRDRVSNLESLLATAQSLKDVKVLVLYEPACPSACPGQTAPALQRRRGADPAGKGGGYGIRPARLAIGKRRGVFRFTAPQPRRIESKKSALVLVARILSLRNSIASMSSMG
jgi:hypothetical protein